MAIITISRGSSSGGAQLATCVGEALGYEVLSREVLTEAAERYGIAESKLVAALEKGPGLLDRFLNDGRRYVAIVQAALCERVAGDSIVYHGRAGHLLLRGVRHVLRVRLIAPMEYRVRQVVEKRQIDAEQALRYIERVDRERASWTRHLYGVDWQDPSLYDLVLNLERLDVEAACEAVAAMARRPQFQADEESRRALEDLRLASRVRAALAADERTLGADVQVRAHGGEVEIEGKLADPELVEAVTAKARRVDGVRQVRYGTRVMLGG